MYEQISDKTKSAEIYNIMLGAFPYYNCYVIIKLINEEAKKSKISLLKFLYINW